MLYKGNAVPSSAKADVQAAGGTFVHAYDQIGVAIARSDSATFADRLARDKRVEGVSSTARLRVEAGRAGGRRRRGPAARRAAERAGDRRRHVLAAAVGHAADPHAAGARDHGRQPAVVVGDIDTGLD